MLYRSEVCKISVRSAQKLLDHVNFSPLHKAALEGGGKLVTGTDSAASVSVGQRRLLYDGTKLFWRINETLELCIYEDTGAYSVTVMAFRQDPVQQVPQQAVTPVVLDSLRLRKVLGLQVSAAFDANEANSAELMSKFVLSRLQAKRDEGGATSLYLQPLHDGEPDPMLLLHRQGNGLHAQLAFPADLSVRRRHTIDDVKEAEQGVKTAAAELRHARQQAESFSQLARISLEAFSRRHSPSKPDESKRRTSDWSRVYDRVALQNAVDRNRDAVSSFERRKE